MTTDLSSYLDYLPPVLWRDEPVPPAFSLGRFLLTPEKLLTGLDDGVPVLHGDHEHVSIEQTLDDLYKLFNPFKVQSDDPGWLAQWLEYLAFWVGVKLLPAWDEHQKRKLIQDAVALHNLRGLKRGLFKHLEIYLVSQLQPRIAIDVGEAILRLPLSGDDSGRARNVFAGPPVLHPLSVIVDMSSPSFEGDIVTGDFGALDEYLIPAKIWRMRPYGELDYREVAGRVEYAPMYDGSPLLHIIGVHPLIDGMPIFTPVALVDDPAGFYGIADAGSLTGASKILRLSKYPPYATTAVTLAWAGPPMVKAVAMARNAAGHYVVLDRGNFNLNVSAEGSVQIVVIDPAANPAATPTGAVVGVPLALPVVIEPAGLAILANGHYLVADLGDSRFGGFGPGGAFRPAEVYDVDPGTGVASPLLAGLPPGSPLPASPTAIAVEAEGTYLVLDYGLKARLGSTAVVQPAALWRLRVPPTAAQTELELVSADQAFVRPSAMAFDAGGLLIVADQGEVTDDVDWRVPAFPHHFGVMVNFDQTSPEALRTTRAIGDIVRDEKPGHASFTLKR
jgi:phage tail-like protein